MDKLTLPTTLQSLIAQYENGAITLEDLGSALYSNHLAIKVKHAMNAVVEGRKIRERQRKRLETELEWAYEYGRRDYMEPDHRPKD